MGTKIIYVGQDGKPLGKKKRKHPPKRATQPTPQANRTWGDRRQDKLIEEGPPGLTREQHQEIMRQEAGESRKENKRLRDEYEKHLYSMRHLKPSTI